MEVNRRLAERVWAASEDGLRNAQIADRMRCSMKTVARVRSARTAFESGDTDKHIAGKTGWSERRVARCESGGDPTRRLATSDKLSVPGVETPMIDHRQV